jgi:acetylornithine/succinyldiaminopimelate/putrescine aminotransferase
MKCARRGGYRGTERDGVFIYDENGKRYIDCITSGSVYNLGRRPRAVISALKKAVRRTDQGNFPMISLEKAALAARVAAFSPAGLECVVSA